MHYTTHNSYRAKYERIELPSNVVIEKKHKTLTVHQNEKNTKLTSSKKKSESPRYLGVQTVPLT